MKTVIEDNIKRNTSEKLSDKIEACRNIITYQYPEEIDGFLVDTFTATNIVKVFDAVSKEFKIRFCNFHIKEMANIAREVVEVRKKI